MVDSAGRVLQKFEANTAPHTSRRRRDSGKVRKCAAGFNLTRVAALLIAVCPGVTVDLRGAKPLVSAPAAPRRPNALRRQIEFDHFDHGDQRMTPTTLAPLRLGLVAVVLLCAPAAVVAQGLVQGVQQGAQAGNKAAGPVGGVLGGAIGGVVGVFTGVLGVGNNAQAPAANGTNAPPNGAKQTGPAKAAKAAAKSGKAAKQGPPVQDAAAPPATEAPAPAPAQEVTAPPQQTAVLTQEGAPQLTAEQIVANSDANIDRIKAELNLTPVQAKNWSGFSSAMHYLSHNGADRLNLRMARAKRDPPDDIIEQMRNEAQFLNDRAIDQHNVADAAEPLFTSLDDKQKAVFIEEMVRLSHERGLD
jgi:hypothetical protein